MGTLIRSCHSWRISTKRLMWTPRTLAETLAVSGAKLPATEEGEEHVRLEERVGQLRHLIETLDLLYDAFLSKRLGSGWPEELGRMQKWLQREERGRLAAAG